MNNENEDLNDLNDEKLDEDSKKLQREIYLVSQERKKTIEETEIIKRRINLMIRQEKDLKKNNEFKMGKINNIIEKKKDFVKNEEIKYKRKQKEEEDNKLKKEKILNQKILSKEIHHNKKPSVELEKYNTNKEELERKLLIEEQKNILKQCLLNQIQKQNFFPISENNN